jgi:metal-responsive CopG/Arc/MetJ family transcriptional regulator
VFIHQPLHSQPISASLEAAYVHLNNAYNNELSNAVHNISLLPVFTYLVYLKTQNKIEMSVLK